MVGKLTRLTQKIVIQLHLVAENCTSWPVWKLLDTPLYTQVWLHLWINNHTPNHSVKEELKENIWKKIF